MRFVFGLLAALVAASAQVTYQDLLQADPNNWLHYNGAYHSRRHSPLRQVHTGNVAALAPKWIYHIPGASRLESVPIVVEANIQRTWGCP